MFKALDKDCKASMTTLFNTMKENILFINEKIKNLSRGVETITKMEILKLNSISEIKYPLGRLGKSRMEITKENVRKQEIRININHPI